MGNIMGLKKGVTLVLAAMLWLAPGVSAYASGTPEPARLAVMMYADWCGSCKVLDPKLKAVQPEFERSSLLFVRFDFSNENTTHQSAMLARVLGLTELYAQNAGKTGYLALVDRASGKVLERITKERSEQEIRGILKRALAK